MTEALIHRTNNYPDLIQEMPKYCCPLEIYRDMTKILNYLLRPPSRGLDHAADFIQFNVFLIHSWADDERLVHNPRLLQISDQILATVLSFKTSRLGWCPMLGAVVYSEMSQSPLFVNGLKEPGHGYERTKPGFILRVLSVCCIVFLLTRNQLRKNEKHQTRVSLLLELVSDAYLTANRTCYMWSSTQETTPLATRARQQLDYKQLEMIPGFAAQGIHRIHCVVKPRPHLMTGTYPIITFFY